MRYSCPDPDCEATDFPPVNVDAFEDAVPMAICAGKCGETFPRSAFKRTTQTG